jgi:hypothetical protein
MSNNEKMQMKAYRQKHERMCPKRLRNNEKKTIKNDKNMRECAQKD